MMESCVELYGDNIAFHVKDKVGAHIGDQYKEAKTDMDALGTALISMGTFGESHIHLERIGMNGDIVLSVVCGTESWCRWKDLGASELEQLIIEAELSVYLYTKI